MEKEKTLDRISWKAELTIYKWKDLDNRIAAFLQQGRSIEDTTRFFGTQPVIETMHDNVALNEGLCELIDMICGLGTPTKWDNANARLGVGNSNTAAQATDTSLLGASKTFKVMDATYPQRSNQTAEWRATFGSAEANYAWEEYTVVNAADDAGKNLNRKVESKGSKSSGETWTLSLKITFG